MQLMRFCCVVTHRWWKLWLFTGYGFRSAPNYSTVLIFDLKDSNFTLLEMAQKLQ